jgi:anti-sigma factor RsiW
MTPADCQHARRTLEDLLDGYLPAESARATEAHLVACAACAREYEGLLALRAALRELPVPELRNGFVDEALAAAAARAGAAVRLPQAREHSPAHRWFAKRASRPGLAPSSGSQLRRPWW